MIKGPIDADRYLEPLVLVLIVLWCGPEVFAVIELTTLLELLGATLFLFAFGASFRMLAVSILDFIGRVLLPLECRALLRRGAGWGAMLVGFRLVFVNGVTLFVLCFIPFLIVSRLLHNV